MSKLSKLDRAKAFSFPRSATGTASIECLLVVPFRSQRPAVGGVMPIEEGEGDAGILITTSEDEGINSEAIEGQIRSFLGSELATIKRADIDGNDRIANLSGELTELRAEVARLRAERLDRASEDVAETSRHSSDPLSPCTG